jgi:tetratricopeptide (TPR) repeat protein
MIPPLSPAELAILCQCAFFSGDYRSSFLAAGELANHSPDVLPGLYWKAKSAERLGISALRQVGVLAPESPRLHFMLGELYRLKWQEEQAAAEYQKVLDVQPENVAARISLADAYNRSTRYNEAISELRGVLAVDGQQPDANYLMGSILVNQHQFTQALPYLETALKGSTPKAPLIHALISRVLAARGKTAEAVSELKQALGADPDGSLHYQLSLLYRKLGDQRAAAVALEQSRAISLNGMRRRQPDNISKVPPSNMLLTPRTGADYETTEKRVH